MSEGPFGYSLLRQSFGEGAHSNRTWLLGGGSSSSSTPDLLACRRRLSRPPCPLLRLADTLHHHHQHPRGRPYLTLSQHVHSCLATHTEETTEDNLSWRVYRKITKLSAHKCVHSLATFETGYYRVRKLYWTITGLTKSVLTLNTINKIADTT